MKERPILFSGPMVKAILEGRKTQTRRIVKQVPHWQHCGKDIMEWGLSGCYTDNGQHWLDIQTEVDDNSHEEIRCPYGKPGERLWVRETWAAWDSVSDLEASELECSVGDMVEMGISQAHISYRADPGFHAYRWRPSIFMPRWASRITLEIVSVRVERLQDISDEDAIAEGVGSPVGTPLRYGSVTEDWNRRAFASLWQSINGPGSWDANTWVWVVEFKRVTS